MTSKMFLHEHSDFPDLIRIVATERGISEGLVEKDYWVTHSLWGLQNAGLTVWFKGGTSLSKGFGLIERFSEDLDLKLEGPGLPVVSSWSSTGKAAAMSRRAYFEELKKRITIPGTVVEELEGLRDENWRSIVMAVRYPSTSSQKLSHVLRPYVQLEMGSARVVPGKVVRIGSWLYDYAVATAANLKATLIDNNPKIHCVVPAVTLLEKVEAIGKRFRKQAFDPAAFVRHYEDGCRILREFSTEQLSELLEQMKAEGDIRSWPTPDDPAFNPGSNPSKWLALEKAWSAIQPMYWGERISLEECAASLRNLLRDLTPSMHSNAVPSERSKRSECPK